MNQNKAVRTPQIGTMEGRDAFMKRIANRLGRSEPLQMAPERPFVGVPEHYAAIRTTVRERIEQFDANWSALTGVVWTVRSEDAAEAIPVLARRICAEREITRVSRWDHPDLNAIGLDAALEQDGVSVLSWREDGVDEHYLNGLPEPEASSAWSKRSPLLRAAERSRLGIVWADYAVSNTGTLVLLARGGRGRSVSLLPDTLFAIIRADTLVTRMGEAFEAVRRDYPEAAAMPSSINLITGPSRSADIENDLTIGIHGPGKVYAVILES